MSRSTSWSHSGYLLALLSLVLLSGTAHGQAAETDYKALVAQYVDRVQNLYDGTWAYTYTQQDRLENETMTRRIDPSRAFPDHDVLLAVNGQTPSAERLERHHRMLERQHKRELRREQRNARRRNEGERNTEFADERDEKTRFMDMLIPESIRLVKQEGDLLYLAFRGMEEERRHIFEHLEGLLIVDTRQQFIRELQVRLTQPFYPFFLTKVEDGFFSMRFKLVDGLAIQDSMTWKLLGQALVVKNLDADMEVTWRDQSMVAAASGSANHDMPRRNDAVAALQRWHYSRQYAERHHSSLIGGAGFVASKPVGFTRNFRFAVCNAPVGAIVDAAVVGVIVHDIRYQGLQRQAFSQRNPVQCSHIET